MLNQTTHPTLEEAKKVFEETRLENTYEGVVLTKRDDEFLVSYFYNQPCWGWMRKYNKDSIEVLGERKEDYASYPEAKPCDLYDIFPMGEHLLLKVYIGRVKKELYGYVFGEESPWRLGLDNPRYDEGNGELTVDTDFDPTVFVNLLRQISLLSRKVKEGDVKKEVLLTICRDENFLYFIRASIDLDMFLNGKVSTKPGVFRKGDDFIRQGQESLFFSEEAINYHKYTQEDFEKILKELNL